MSWSPTASPRHLHFRRLLVFAISAFFVVVVLIALQPASAQRQPASKLHQSIEPRKNQVLVQLSTPPVAAAVAQAGVRNVRVPSASFDDNSRASSVASQAAQRVESEQQRFIAECKAANLSVTVDSTFSTLANLISVYVSSPSHIDALRQIPGVRNVFPVLSGPLPKSKTARPLAISVDTARALFQPQVHRLHRRENDSRHERPAGARDAEEVFGPDRYHQSLNNLTRLATVRELDPSLTGQGVKVGVISSGIDWKHPAFVREGQACENWGDGGCRVKHGWACQYVGPATGDDSGNNDNVRMQPMEPNEVPADIAALARRSNSTIKCVSAEETAGDAVDDHCWGIGTNIASVVGGDWNKTVNGVAPGVTFGAYNIRPCIMSDNSATEGTLEYTTHLFLRIVERAYNDGMDVLVIEPTFRYGFHTQDSVESFMISLLADTFGITTVVPAGELRAEEPANTPHRIESPAHSNGALAVTSITSPVHPFDSINVTIAPSRSDGLIQRRLRVLAPLNPNTVRNVISVFETGQQYRLATSPHLPSAMDDGCPNGNHTWPEGYFAGHVAVVRFTSRVCGIMDLFAAAKDARAAGVVFYDDQPQLPSHIGVDWSALMLPGVMVGGTDGEWLRREVARTVNVSNPLDPSRAKLSMHKRAWVHAETKLTVPAYNRWGPSMDLAIKPDVGCVGEHMVVAASSHVVRDPSIALARGTRMATGYIAGLVALAKQRYPGMSAAELMDRVRNAARPVTALRLGAPFADSVIKQGAGAMIDAYALLVPSVTVTPSKLELGDVPGFPIDGKFPEKKKAKMVMRNTGRTVERVLINGVFAEGVRWGVQTTNDDLLAMPKTLLGPNDITIAPGEQVEVELTLDLSVAAFHARRQWANEGGGGTDPVYGKRPKPSDPPAYGKRRRKHHSLHRRDSDGALDRIDEFPTAELSPSAPPMYFLSGFISFASLNSSSLLASVPYLLFAGDYRGGAYFPPMGQTGAPFLFSEYRTGPNVRDWNSYLHLPNAHVPIFNLTTRGTTPRVGFGLYQPIRRLHLDLIDANTKAFVGKVGVGEFLASGKGQNKAFMYPSSSVGAVWEGDLIPPPRGSNLPSRVTNGTYMYRVSLYKFAPLTDPERGKQPIVWTSPPFIVRFNSTSDVFGPRGLPNDAVLPWDQNKPNEGGNSEPTPEPSGTEPPTPTDSPVPTDSSIPTDPTPTAATTTSEPASSPTPDPNPIGIIIIPGTNSSSSDTARLARRDGAPRQRRRPTDATLLGSESRQAKPVYILGEWTYAASTRPSGSANGDLILPWDNIALLDKDQEVTPSPLVSDKVFEDELEWEEMPEFVRAEMDHYPGQPSKPTSKNRQGKSLSTPGENSTTRPRKKCIIRKNVVYV